MLFVDTSVWSLAFRRDSPPDQPEVARLASALEHGEAVATGLVVQELFGGLRGPKQTTRLLGLIRSITLVRPRVEDHLEAAALGRTCRQAGVQVGTVDALLATLCLRRGLPLLTTDADFAEIARHAPLELCVPPG